MIYRFEADVCAEKALSDDDDDDAGSARLDWDNNVDIADDALFMACLHYLFANQNKVLNF